MKYTEVTNVCLQQLFLAAPSLLIFGGFNICVCGFCCKDSSVQNQIIRCLLCFLMFEFLLCAEYCKFCPPLLYRAKIHS